MSAQVVNARDVGPLTEWEEFGVVRRRWGIQQLWLAADSGISQPHISGWERRGEGLKDWQIVRLWVSLDVAIAQAIDDSEESA